MKIKQIQILTALAILFILVFGYLQKDQLISYSHDKCVEISPEDVTSQAQVVDSSKLNYSTSTRQILGKSTDGGVQINYLNEGEILLSEVGLFGETENYKASFFVQNKKVYYLHEEIIRFERSIYSEDFNPTAKNVEIKDYYFDDQEKLCSWFINQEPQYIDQNIRKSIADKISELWH